MKHLWRAIYGVFPLACLGLLCVISWAESPPNVRFDVVPQPDVPIALTNISVQNDSGREISQLRYTLKNETGADLKEFDIMLTFFNDLGQPLGGESFRQHVHLKPNESKTFQTALRHYVQIGHRVGIAFSGFKTNSQAWRSERKPLLEAMKQKAWQVQ